MCGIFGTITTGEASENTAVELATVLPQIEQLFTESLSRGSEAAGIAVLQNSEVYLAKTSNQAKQFLSSSTYQKTIKNIGNKPVQAVIGHARLATNGTVHKHKNNQPVVSQSKRVIGVHNGIITNCQEIYRRTLRVGTGRKKTSSAQPELDTQILLDYMEALLLRSESQSTQHKSIDLRIHKIIAQVLAEIEGTANLALIFPQEQRVALITNNGSLHYSKDSSGRYYFASESVFLKKIGLSPTITQVKPGEFVLFSTKKTSSKQPAPKIHFQLAHSTLSATTKNSLDKLKKHTIDNKKIAAILRCTRCILPFTTPFIQFDSTGVCNYCREHTPIRHSGEHQLEQVLQKYRRTDGRPDCLVAFSGGRDSSYGLHLIKNKLGMNPIAFTYDWGMISELGRRNQARVLAKLGIEQILVSADIEMKRRHIQKNILAWTKKPHLGMVPLFMQGDKQCEYYADQIMKKYDIQLMFYCRGNELEKEEFKAGHCGVKDADPGGVIHHLSLLNKLRLLRFYGLQYLQNPSYFNESFFETAFAYFATYIQPHNYLYLWHYLPWDEKTIVRTLTKEYNWELAPETTTSWRIGDGTPAFYNYIYYQVQGFTENDSLRARQVREGILTREQALELVQTENQPQCQALKWYFDTLDLDGDRVLDVVDKMKKLY